MAYAEIRHHESGASWSGVVSCGSVWHCPECAARVSKVRQAEIAGLVEAHQAAGGLAVMLTLTLPHNAYDQAKELRTDVAALWARVIAGRPWKRAIRRAGVIGGFRALEVTHGGHGWHPHLHVLIFVELTDRQEIPRFMDWLVSRWIAAAERRGYQCSMDAQKWVWASTPEGAGDYVTKWGVDWEITHAHLKKAKRGGRNPFQILADYAETKDPKDGWLFVQYAKAFKGARQLTAFGAVRERYGMSELSDQDVLAAQETVGETVCFIDEFTFHAVMDRGLEVGLLEAAERGGLHGVLSFLAMHGISVSGVKPPEFSRRLRTFAGRARHGP